MLVQKWCGWTCKQNFLVL